MNHPTRYWRVDFSGEGGISAVTEISGPANAEWVVVEASSYEGAKRAAYNLYCRRKKKLARQRNYALGNCACGRKNDRTDQKHPKTGEPLKTCSVCSVRHEVHVAGYEQRKAAGITDHQRDEAARVASNRERQRDRRGELRLETLLEVQKAWVRSPNLGAFSKWLATEIRRLTGADASKEAAA